MKTRLFKGLTDQEVQDLKGSYLQATLIRSRLVQLLEDDNKALMNILLENEGYNHPDWKSEHIETLAKIKANRGLISLISN